MNEHDSEEHRPFLDVLGLCADEHLALLEELDRAVADAPLPPGAPDQRQARRVPYRGVRGVILQVAHPGGTSGRYLVRSRNISETGLGVHHGGYIHPATPCIVALRTLRGEACIIHGRVVACRHIRGRIHEVGIAFSERLALNEFVREETSVTDT